MNRPPDFTKCAPSFHPWCTIRITLRNSPTLNWDSLSDNNLESSRNLEPISRQEDLDGHALDHASFEPTARVEQTQGFQTAAAVEGIFNCHGSG